ncbi:MAG: response regulator [Pyrinomonadaceae bacterium]
MSKRKLLLADDSMTIQKVVNLTFADEGIEVFTVGNGSLAIERLSEIEPDLVLADVHMPGLTGYEVCEQIRMHPRFKDVPVMLLVGSFEPFDESEAKRVGANDYLTKPFQSIRQLIQKVTALLADPNSETDEVNESEATVISTEANGSQDTSSAEVNQNVFEETPIISQNNVDLSAHEMSFGDTALDDEMIETSSAGNLGSDFSDPMLSSQFESQSSGEITTSSAEKVSITGDDLTSDENIISEDIDPEMRRTEPLSYNDIQEINSSMLAPVEPEKNDEWQTIESETNISDETTASVNADQTPPSGNWEQNQYGGESDQELDIELDLSAPQEELSETSDFEIIRDEEMLPMETRAEETASLAVSPTSKTVMNDYEPLELDLDEMNLLQIDDEDSILDLQTEEATTAVSMADLEVLPQMQDFNQSPNSRLSQVAGQAVSTMNLDFPPHVIEAIAQLVVEKLSDKVIEKIAWEIVPDRFDLIVRKQMEQRDR